MSGAADVLHCSDSGCRKPLPPTTPEYSDSPIRWTHVGPEGEAVFSAGKSFCLDCWDMKVKIAREGVVVYLETELLNDGGDMHD